MDSRQRIKRVSILSSVVGQRPHRGQDVSIVSGRFERTAFHTVYRPRLENTHVGGQHVDFVQDRRPPRATGTVCCVQRPMGSCGSYVDFPIRRRTRCSKDVLRDCAELERDCAGGACARDVSEPVFFRNMTYTIHMRRRGMATMAQLIVGALCMTCSK